MNLIRFRSMTMCYLRILAVHFYHNPIYYQLTQEQRNFTMVSNMILFSFLITTCV